MTKKHVSYLLLILLSSCSGSDFSGSSDGNKNAPAQNPSTDPAVGGGDGTPINGTSTSTSGGIGTDLGSLSFLDYKACASTANQGVQSGGQCEAGKAMVIINDGTAKGITCCPLSGNVLTGAATLRTGACQSDEVATGMFNMSTSSVYCTKVDTQTYSVEDAGASIHMSQTSSSSNLQPLVSKYNNLDCCSCPEGTILAGDHSSKDGKCTDKCVKIKKIN